MNRLKLLLAMAGASLLAACASTTAPYTEPTARAPTTAPAPVAPTPDQSATAVVPAQTRINRALDLLHHGEPQAARLELAAVLSQLDDPTARHLLDQIDRDPRALLGERNFAYRMRPGETLSSLAGRFLGDPLLFYALARYNGIEDPDAAEPGRTLLIPGGPKRVVPATPAGPAVTAKAAPAAPATNPTRASDLRRRALEDMSRGSVDLAVSLLQQAEPLDPNNPLIRTDLDRALRIQASLKQR